MYNIKILLKNRGRNQRWLAKKLKVHHCRLNHWITGRTATTKAPMGQICVLLGVTMHTLCTPGIIIQTHKRCPDCEKLLLLSAFGFNARLAGNINSLCKKCTNKRTAKFRTSPQGRTYFRKYMKGYHQSSRGKQLRNVWRKRNTAKCTASKRRHNKLHPDRAKARSIISYLIHSGKIKRPDHCSNCGLLRKVDSHHPDYSKPLEIIWLCRSCHLAIHRKRVG